MFAAQAMINNTLKYFFAFVILLHCLGVTQLVSSYGSDKSIFMGMISMAEEETKKESQSKEDSDNLKLHKNRHILSLASFFTNDNRIYLSESKVRITDQFVSDNLTPPPDCLG